MKQRPGALELETCERSNAVRVTVMTLRRKLGEPRLVHTVVGAGYRIGGEE